MEGDGQVGRLMHTMQLVSYRPLSVSIDTASRTHIYIHHAVQLRKHACMHACTKGRARTRKHALTQTYTHASTKHYKHLKTWLSITQCETNTPRAEAKVYLYIYMHLHCLTPLSLALSLALARPLSLGSTVHQHLLESISLNVYTPIYMYIYIRRRHQD